VLGIHDLVLFILSGLLLNVTPGPDTFFILSHAATRGARGGAMAALGISAGCLVHIVGATIGLSALLLASATAFAVVKWLGAVYLIWIGISLLRTGAPAGADAGAAPTSDRHIFVRGALTNILNPKVAMFFVAFLPQFVDPAGPHRALAFLALGLLFNVNSTFWNLSVAYLAAGAVARRPASRRYAGWFARGVGALFVALGLKLALAARPVS
jgi:threonine/homoserine/homoserine lactone efflux protein